MLCSLLWTISSMIISSLTYFLHTLLVLHLMFVFHWFMFYFYQVLNKIVLSLSWNVCFVQRTVVIVFFFIPMDSLQVNKDLLIQVLFDSGTFLLCLYFCSVYFFTNFLNLWHFVVHFIKEWEIYSLTCLLFLYICFPRLLGLWYSKQLSSLSSCF